MKLSIGYRLQDGPWGGGNNFATSLSDHMIARGHTVVFNLDDDDIDIILLTDPRSRAPTISFGAGAVLRYLVFKNPNAVVVHRINECDERKNTRTMNDRLRRANYCADHTVFIASWLKDLAVWRGGPHSVVLNGADTSVFHPEGHATWTGSEPLRLVTHHWGGNWMKGFDVYQQLDDMLAQETWKDRLDFTYIGNSPSGFRFKNAKHLEPMQGVALANELRAHHVYLTASINEPAGMHHIEGASCGLPLLYRRSGALPEYCDGFGEPFNGLDEFVGALSRIIENYEQASANISGYARTAQSMCSNYAALFDDLISRREDIVAQRRIFQGPYLFLRNQIPV